MTTQVAFDPKELEAKVKAIRPLADRMVTLAKRESLHARRQALVMMPDVEVVRRLFDTIGARYAERNGGYTRIIHAGVRRGDAAPMVLLELVDSEASKKPLMRGAKTEVVEAEGEKKPAKAGRAKKEKVAAEAKPKKEKKTKAEKPAKVDKGKPAKTKAETKKKDSGANKRSAPKKSG